MNWAKPERKGRGMKQVVLGVFLGLFLALVLGVLAVVGLVKLAASGASELPAKALLVLDWEGSLPGHRIDPTQADFNTPVTLSHVLEALREAATQDEIQGILIDRPLDMPREYLSELHEALAEFRRSGKPVLAHLDMAIGNAYMAACLADGVAISPARSGGLLLPGPQVSLLYMGEALQRLGIQVHVLHQGDAKGFGEPYAQSEMSPPVRENLGQLVDDLLAGELAWVAARRSVDPGLLRRDLSQPGRLWITPQEALNMGLADTLLSRSDWDDAIEARFPDAERLSLCSWIGSRSSLEGLTQEGPAVENHVAVLWAEGGIVPGGEGGAQVRIATRDMVKEIRQLAEADAVQAVVLRVESPGGSALASEEIYQELVKLGQHKPLWVSMGPVAASGGYYLSVPGECLFTSSNSIVGSIGVVALVPDLSGAARKLGLNPQSITSLPAARLFTLGEEVDPALLASLERNMAGVYQEFRQRVLAHRPLSSEELDPIAAGRVWAGGRAVELGLADCLGGLGACVDSLQKNLGGAPLPVHHYPRQLNLVDLLLSGKIKPWDLLPMGRLERTASLLGAPPLLRDVEADPRRLLDPRWMLRAEVPLVEGHLAR